eukprot:symbB.v1.2.015257.t1/scaffold1130.1/size136251/4
MRAMALDVHGIDIPGRTLVPLWHILPLVASKNGVYAEPSHGVTWEKLKANAKKFKKVQAAPIVDEPGDDGWGDFGLDDVQRSIPQSKERLVAMIEEEFMGVIFSGLPLPPHLPWAPGVNPTGGCWGFFREDQVFGYCMGSRWYVEWKSGHAVAKTDVSVDWSVQECIGRGGLTLVGS